MMLASSSNLWQVAGLVYALAGAALLCNAVFLIPAPSRSTVSRDAHTLRRAGEQWLDARIGAVLLVAGFFFQATGALGTATLNKPAIFVLLGLAFAAGYYGLMRDLLIDDALAAGDTATVRDAVVQEAEKPVAAKEPAAAAPVVRIAPEQPAPKVVDLRTSAAVAE